MSYDSIIFLIVLHNSVNKIYVIGLREKKEIGTTVIKKHNHEYIA